MDERNENPRDRDVLDTREEPVDEERRMDSEAAETRDRAMGNERRMEDRPAQTRAPMEATEDELAPLFELDAAQKFRDRWLTIQSRFVDDPSESVKQADDLVTDVIQSITRNFADRRGSLEKQWNSGNTSTEDLRIALTQYRSFFERLLSLQS